ncbi:2-oxo-hept-4-ene-1,7-dioate hydratase [Williamsia muralis]|uniref:2-oxo-hepta-3-ene-1,7-dioic acid hydratase n=1 Tax=Williamsia marianensis TaxID=85044 RepID=A0ABU4EYX6_WILMA|nr:2-oxo-hepta-3-ene-1,7-dioic acid hydratase [Williamsia muralis]MDV7136464.1 2-oxo-hepta-3-ene-1,7-dioic acid hydratase [Williamsia muralis]
MTNTTLLDTAVAELARRLHEAEQTRVPIRQISLQYPEMTIEDSYAVQRELIRLKVEGGAVVRGRKIGLTSKVMQRAVSITEPDYGALLDDMFFDDGAVVPANRFIRPRIEVELAFILGESLSGPGVTLYNVLRAAEYVTPALEILDARVQMADPETGHLRTIVDTISDNAADAGIVLGGRVMKPMDVDLRWVAALLLKNGSIEDSGVAASVLGHPANGVAWLANRLAPHGVSLNAGEVILAGSFTAPVFAEPGDTFVADYGPMGTVSIHFAKESSS